MTPEPIETSRYFPAPEGECAECAQHCPVGFVPHPERVCITHTGRPLCSLCYQFNRTARQVKRVRPNTLHPYLEKYAKLLAQDDDQLVQTVLPWKFGATPVRPRPASWPSESYAGDNWVKNCSQAAQPTLTQMDVGPSFAGENWVTPLTGPLSIMITAHNAANSDQR